MSSQDDYEASQFVTVPGSTRSLRRSGAVQMIPSYKPLECLDSQATDSQHIEYLISKKAAQEQGAHCAECSALGETVATLRRELRKSTCQIRLLEADVEEADGLGEGLRTTVERLEKEKGYMVDEIEMLKATVCRLERSKALWRHKANELEEALEVVDADDYDRGDVKAVALPAKRRKVE